MLRKGLPMRWRVSGGTQPHVVRVRDGPGRPGHALVDDVPVEIRWGPVFGLLRVGEDEARILARAGSAGLTVSLILTGSSSARAGSFDLLVLGRQVDVLPDEG